jgi:hypothetical protein
MGKTVIEKIIQDHTADEVAPGKSSGWTWTFARPGISGPNVVKNYEREYAGLPLADRSRHSSPSTSAARALKYTDNQQACRDFARKNGWRSSTWTTASAPSIWAGRAGTVVGTDGT